MKIENKKAYIPCEIVENQINNGLDIRVRIDKTHDLYINRKLLIPDIDQPKLVVPKFVADWYEEHKDKLEEELCYQIWLIRESGAETDFEYWLAETENPIKTIINMDEYGYTVEKEKLYTVEIPNPNTIAVTILVKSNNGKIVMCNECDINWKCNNRYQLTEQEIRKDFDWAWQFAKEVD